MRRRFRLKFVNTHRYNRKQNVLFVRDAWRALPKRDANNENRRKCQFHSTLSLEFIFQLRSSSAVRSVIAAESVSQWHQQKMKTRKSKDIPSEKSNRFFVFVNICAIARCAICICFHINRSYFDGRQQPAATAPSLINGYRTFDTRQQIHFMISTARCSVRLDTLMSSSSFSVIHHNIFFLSG